MASPVPLNIPIPEVDLRQTPASAIEFIQTLLVERERLLAEIQGLKARIERLVMSPLHCHGMGYVNSSPNVQG